ncbi:aspartate 1-decarboxylase [Bradyrhizobium sp. S3.12.5]
MQITLMKGKILRASVTEADLHSDGQISIDCGLLDAAGFLINERVEIYNIETERASPPLWRKPPRIWHHRFERSGCA